MFTFSQGNKGLHYSELQCKEDLNSVIKFNQAFFFSIQDKRTRSNMNVSKYARFWVKCYAGQNPKKLSQQVTASRVKRLAIAAVDHLVMIQK